MHNHEPVVILAVEEPRSDPEEVFPVLFFQRNVRVNTRMDEQIRIGLVGERKRSEPIDALVVFR